jgi:hypothetical protein
VTKTIVQIVDVPERIRHVPAPTSCHGLRKQDFVRWLDKREARVCYATGMLAEHVERGNIGLKKLRDQVWSAYSSGLVHLVQKRLGPYVFEYWAVRNTRRKR